MKPTLRPGLTGRLEYVVPAERTVPYLLPEAEEFTVLPEVLATGYLVGIVEWTCMLALAWASRRGRGHPRGARRRQPRGPHSSRGAGHRGSRGDRGRRPDAHLHRPGPRRRRGHQPRHAPPDRHHSQPLHCPSARACRRNRAAVVIDPRPPPLFDAHLHVIDPRHPLVANEGYLPPTFTAQDYRHRTEHLNVVGWCGGVRLVPGLRPVLPA